jgi:FkbM family methyltransferase
MTADTSLDNQAGMDRTRMPQDKVIYDVGMHKGEDTEFYLRRGYSVLGVEANPTLLPFLFDKFSLQVANGQVRIVNKAIAETPGTMQFAIYCKATEWGTAASEFIDRNATLNQVPEIIQVEAVSFEEVLKEHGIPYYLKIDIEGMDMVCINALQKFQERPRFISVESAVTSGISNFESSFDEIARLWCLGYRRFKYVDQAALAKLNGTILDKEGAPISYKHHHYSSGPFGEETPGEWLDAQATLHRARQLIRYQNTIGSGGRHHCRFLSKVGRRSRRYLKRLPSHSWYDLHACLGGDKARARKALCARQAPPR